MVVGFKVRFGNSKLVAENIKAFWPHTGTEVINALFGVSKKDGRRSAGKSLCQTPLIVIGILKFVENNKRKHVGNPRSKARAFFDKARSCVGEQVETN
jgi:hypothetical protein